MYDVSKFASLHPGGENVFYDEDIGIFSHLSVILYSDVFRQLLMDKTLPIFFSSYTVLRYSHGQIMHVCKLVPLKEKILASLVEKVHRQSLTQNQPGSLLVTLVHTITRYVYTSGMYAHNLTCCIRATESSKSPCGGLLTNPFTRMHK